MCIICAKPAGVPMPSESTIDNMWNNNSDGAGIMYNANGRVVIEKGFMTLKATKAALKRIGAKVDLDKVPVVLHFRIGTAGGNIPENTHPFPISDNIAVLKKLRMEVPIGVVHNGIIPITTRQKDISDTMEYIASQMAPLSRAVPRFYEDKNLMLVIKNAIGSKMAFLNAEGEIYTVGDFLTEDGILYSNSTYAFAYSARALYGGKYSATGIYSYPWEDDHALLRCKYLMWLPSGSCVTSADGELFEGDYFLMDKDGDLYEYLVEDDYAVSSEYHNPCDSATGLPILFDDTAAEIADVWDEYRGAMGTTLGFNTLSPDPPVKTKTSKRGKK